MAAARAKKKTSPPRPVAKKKISKKRPARKKASLDSARDERRRDSAAARERTGDSASAPDARAVALAWFDNLSSRISHAGVPELQVLISEARNYDLVGLAEALGSDAEVLALNQAANDLITAGLDTFGAASPQGFQLQVLRDILNDS